MISNCASCSQTEKKCLVCENTFPNFMPAPCASMAMRMPDDNLEDMLVKTIRIVPSRMDETIGVVFNGDVSANEVNEVLKEFYGEVIIKGRLLLNESLNLESNLFVEGSIDAEDTVTSINITGNVFAHAINCNHITISEDLYCLDLNT